MGEDRAAHRGHSTSGRCRSASCRRCRRWRSSRAGTCSITAPPRTTSARWRAPRAATPCATRARCMREPLTLADHHASRFVAEPLRAARLLSRDRRRLRARPHHRPSARAISASRRLTCSPASSASGPAHHHPHDWFALRPPALGDGRRRAAVGRGGRRAPATSTPRCSTTTSRRWCCVALEDWGFCAPGEGGPFVEDGAIRWPDGAPAGEHARRPALRGVHPRLQQSHRGGAPGARHVDLPGAGRRGGLRRRGVERSLRRRCCSAGER